MVYLEPIRSAWLSPAVSHETREAIADKSHLTTVAPRAVRKTLLDTPDEPSETFSMESLGREIVELQLLLYNEHEARKDRVNLKVTSLFDSVSAKIAESLNDSEDPEEDMQTILDSVPPAVLQRSVWKWERIPYSVFRSIAGKRATGSESEDVEERDIDEWILRNERALREDHVSSWQQSLVRLSKHAVQVFPDSSVSERSRTITREATMTGYTFLDNKRATEIQIQPSVASFAQQFEGMSDGLLRGLDWSNVCVAGGIVLGSLLCVDQPGATAKPELWKHSDIDVYIFGLSPVQANAKIRHLFEVYKTNLPVGAPALVVRNSKTITFFSDYPLRRIQIVLKLVKSPKEVLLNFDLDVCSIGWDGSELWMLPRACRALETGYIVFTMNLIHGHYLGERRATREHRLFKYADKGYGIRILSSYMNSLEDAKERIHELSSFANVMITLDVEAIVSKARRWTTKYSTPNSDEIDRRPPGELPTFSHAGMEMYSQKTEAPLNRSCLTGLELLMRHVALWEAECDGRIRLVNEEFAATMYDITKHGVGYDDTPPYMWNSDFHLSGFKYAMDYFNKREQESDFLEYYSVPTESIRRISYASSVDEILEPVCDVFIPVYLQDSFVTFANELYNQALQDNGLHGDPPLRLASAVTPDEYDEQIDWPEVPYFWRTSCITMWQLLDRRIDEIHEILWAFRRANQSIGEQPHQERLAVFKKEVARRAIRPAAGDEFDEFARWVGRVPEPMYCQYAGPEYGWSDDSENEDETEM